jgi:methyltransferase
MAKKQLVVAIPASVIAETPHLREKTNKIGLIGRAAAIFRVGEIVVYADNHRTNQSSDLDVVTTLLRYMETPQYLRKYLFGLKSELQFAGILPPLRTPHHPLQGRIQNLMLGEYREGVVVSKTKDRWLIDIGVEKPAVLWSSRTPIGKRLTVKITRLAGQAEVEIADRNEISEYWGYTVHVERRSLVELLEKRQYDLTIGTSKFATRIQDAVATVKQRWIKANNKLILFGAPTSLPE